MEQLTPQMLRCFNFLCSYDLEHGISPSYREIVDGLCLKSKQRVQELLNALARRGYITRQYAQARSIKIIRSLDNKTVTLSALQASLNEGKSLADVVRLIESRPVNRVEAGPL